MPIIRGTRAIVRAATAVSAAAALRTVIGMIADRAATALRVRVGVMTNADRAAMDRRRAGEMIAVAVIVAGAGVHSSSSGIVSRRRRWCGPRK